MDIRPAPRLLVVLLLLSVWAICLWQLTVYPPVGEDEPWIASTGWQIATQGIFGSPLFRGLWQMDTRYYDFLPLYPLLAASIFRGAGIGLFQARFVSVSLGILLIALTYKLGTRLWSTLVGLVAALLLVIVPLTVPPSSTGSLFFDIARVARYDILVPVCGTSALLLFLYARQRDRWIWFALAGFMSALAGLAHIYGALWLPALLLLSLYERIKKSQIIAVCLGFILPWGVYAIYVVTGWDAFVKQTAWYGDRFDLLNPAWYARNALREIQRYHVSDIPTAFVTLLLFAGALTALGLAIWRNPRSPAIRIALPLVVLLAGLAVLIENKVPNYLILVAPFFALGIAFLFVTIAHRILTPYFVPAVLILCILIMGIRAVNLNTLASVTTGYRMIGTLLRSKVSARDRVLGLHAYWFGMQDIDMRDWIVPLQWSMSHVGVHKMSMTKALNKLAPDVVVVDPRIRSYFSGAQNAPRTAELMTWLRANTFTCSFEFTDATYGTYQLYRRANPSGGTLEKCPAQ